MKYLVCSVTRICSCASSISLNRHGQTARQSYGLRKTTSVHLQNDPIQSWRWEHQLPESEITSTPATTRCKLIRTNPKDMRRYSTVVTLLTRTLQQGRQLKTFSESLWNTYSECFHFARGILKLIIYPNYPCKRMYISVNFCLCPSPRVMQSRMYAMLLVYLWSESTQYLHCTTLVL